MYKPDICFYHYPCTDGIAAAATVYKVYGPDVDYQRLQYGSLKPVLEYIEMCRDKHILMVDCSFTPDILDKVSQSALSIIMIDHHTGVYENLKDYEVDKNTPLDQLSEDRKISYIYDVTKSGASLTWSLLVDPNRTPLIISYIEHNDLGKGNELPNAGAFLWWSRSIPFDIEVMAKHLDTPDAELPSIFESGAAINNFVEVRMQELLTNTRYLTIDAGQIPYVITDYAFASIAAGKLLNDSETDLGIAFYFTKDGLGASLRSKKTDIAKRFAQSLGGNGHDKAAGFNIKWADLPEFLESMEAIGNPIFGNFFNG